MTYTNELTTLILNLPQKAQSKIYNKYCDLIFASDTAKNEGITEHIKDIADIALLYSYDFRNVSIREFLQEVKM